MMDIQDWSTTAGSNTDVDGTDIGEGCDPANINNAIRAVMANVAALRDLLGGAKVSGGTANVQTLTTGLSLSAYAQGLPIGFEAGASNTGACTMNVDGIGAKAVKLADGSDPPAGAITAGGIYHLAYEANADVLILMTPTPVAAGIGSLAEDTTPQLGGDLDLNGNAIDFPSTANIADVLDEDNMASNSATALATQQSIKAYADTKLALAGGTVAGTLAFADNLLTRPRLQDYGEAVNALGSIGGGTQDIDLEAGNVVTGTVDTATTTFTFSNPPASGTAGSFTLVLANGGSQTVNWPASVDWAGAAAPTLTAAGIDVLTFFTTDGGTTWFGFAAGLDMS